MKKEFVSLLAYSKILIYSIAYDVAFLVLAGRVKTM